LTIREESKVKTLPEEVFNWSFTPDSQCILALSPSGRVARWRGKDFGEKELLFATTPVSAGAFSPDGRLLSVGTTNGYLEVWDLQARSLLHKFKGRAESIAPLRFLSEGKSLLAVYLKDGGPNGSSVHRWSLD
jgi:WD40 repeat protein